MEIVIFPCPGRKNCDRIKSMVMLARYNRVLLWEKVPEDGGIMRKILVTEDDNYLRRDLKEILEKNGYCTVAASSVQEAIW